MVGGVQNRRKYLACVRPHHRHGVEALVVSSLLFPAPLVARITQPPKARLCGVVRTRGLCVWCVLCTVFCAAGDSCALARFSVLCVVDMRPIPAQKYVDFNLKETNLLQVSD